MPARARSKYSGSYQRRRDRMVAWARSNPSLARCWRCGEPLVSCGPNRNGRHRNGRPAKWTAGHVEHDPLAPLALECSPCNYREGAQHGNRQRRPAGGGGRISGRRRRPGRDRKSVV